MFFNDWRVFDGKFFKYLVWTREDGSECVFDDDELSDWLRDTLEWININKLLNLTTHFYDFYFDLYDIVCSSHPTANNRGGAILSRSFYYAKQFIDFLVDFRMMFSTALYQKYQRS